VRIFKRDFDTKMGFHFKTNDHKDSSDPWNDLCTAKLNEVILSWLDTFAWQTRQDTGEKECGNSFDQWLRQLQIALRPLLWVVRCNAYTRFKATTMTRLASVYVDLNSKSKARVEGARSFFSTTSCALIQHIHTHTHKHSNHPRCLSASEYCARATPLKHVSHSR